jgi:catechol 2,3-dioxygenase-like lactoylglutathione lyase family enzyme
MHGDLNHIEINVSDLERSISFWAPLLEQLGWTPYQQWSGGRSWRRAYVYLVLAQTDARHAAPFHRRQAGLNHVAFLVADAAAVDAWTAWLKARGIPILYDDRHPHAGGPGYYGVFFEDPDRIKVEIVADRSH